MFLYVANWKMNMSFNQALHFCKYNYDSLCKLSRLPQKRIILCATFAELKSLYEIFKKSSVVIGAQNCSSYTSGAYTGQVSVESLSEIGCSYCIIGHSEGRKYFCETDEDIADKMRRLLSVGVEPIICVGEKKDEFEAGLDQEVVEAQVLPILEIVKKFKKSNFCIAYEPVWSIGTGIIPEMKHIKKVFEFILELSKKYTNDSNIKFLYGGSVDESNIAGLKSIDHIEGFLIGSTSLDFQKFEKIVTL